MVDYSSVGFSLTVAALGSIGGFLDGGTFFFANLFLKKRYE